MEKVGEADAGRVLYWLPRARITSSGLRDTLRHFCLRVYHCMLYVRYNRLQRKKTISGIWVVVERRVDGVASYVNIMDGTCI